jgi:membrane-associated phospholipid phosphatase
MESLFYGRKGVIRDGAEGAVQSVAGFASLHVAITLLVALMVQYTLRNKVLHIVFWTNFAITVVATLYFGWHYIADDLAGAAIAIIAFRVAARATGHDLRRAAPGEVTAR